MYISEAKEQVQAELSQVNQRKRGLKAFAEEVREIHPDAAHNTNLVTSDAGQYSQVSNAHSSGCRRVRKAFAEHMVQDEVKVEEEETVELIGEEYTETIAAALSPASCTPFSAKIQQVLLAETTLRVQQSSVYLKALQRELEYLNGTKENVYPIIDWITEANSDSLHELSFEPLKTRYSKLESWQEECDALARRRQEFISSTTTQNAEARITHRALLESAYDELPVTHPVLASIAELYKLCDECKDSVRKHLCRRA